MKKILAALLLLPAVAWADQEPDKTRVNNRCTQYRMCDAQTSTGICTSRRNSDEIVLEVGRYAYYTFSAIPSTATTYSCDILSNHEGYDADNTSDQVNTTSISDSAPMYSLGALLRYFWMTCSTITGGNVTIDVVVCPMD